MMAVRAIFAGALIAVAAACGAATNNSATAGNAQAAGTQESSNAQKAVGTLSDGERNGVLIRAIRDAGFACQHVPQSERIEIPNATPVYMATCDDRAVYAIAVRDDGTMAVREAMREEGKK